MAESGHGELSLFLVRPEQDGEARRFLSDHFGRVSEERWNWFFRENPDGDAIMAAGRIDAVMVGINAVVPRKLAAHGRPISGGQDSYLVTHEGYRRRGIMRKVVAHNWEEADRAGVDVIFIFQAQDNPSRPGFIRCGGIDLGRVVQHMRILDASYLLRRVFPFSIVADGFAKVVNALLRCFEPPAPQHTLVDPVTVFDERFTELWRRVAPTLPCACVRDAAWLTYRFAHHPEKRYEILAATTDQDVSGEKNTLTGYAVLEHRLAIGAQPAKTMIIDFLAETGGEAASALLGEILRRARKRGSSAAYVWIDKPAPWYSQFRRVGFVRQKGVHGVLVQRIRSDRNDLDGLDLTSWYLAMGDSDLY